MKLKKLHLTLHIPIKRLRLNLKIDLLPEMLLKLVCFYA